MNRRRFIWMVMMLTGLVLGGCRDVRPAKPRGYYGPTQSLAEVTGIINQNNRAIVSLWASHDFEADIADETGHRNFINGDGTLMYSRPDRFRLLGDKPVVGRVFDIGANAERYWLLLPEQVRMMWWGYTANLGRDCATTLPIRPDLFLEVLGIGEFTDDYRADPAPVMRFNNDADAYMFLWIQTRPDRLIAQKEIWYDRTSKLPKLVLLFDADGRIVLRAYLSDHQPVEVPNTPPPQRPRIATRFELFFPDNASTMTFVLRDPRLSRRGFPRPASFAFPENPTIPTENVIQVDADCTQ